MKDTAGIVEAKIETPEQLFELFEKLKGYVFRGQSNDQWQLATSLERSVKSFCPNFTEIVENREHWMLHEFKRKSHLYSMHSIHTPHENDHVEWLAIMQHFGCPTRLLDFTDSPQIGTFFAINDATSDSAVWALDWWTMRDNLQKRFSLNYEPRKILRDEINRLHLEFANKHIANQKMEKDLPLSLVPLLPKKFTDRISRQQGLFVMPTNAKRPFMANLAGSFGLDDNAYKKIEQIKVEELLTKNYMDDFHNSKRPSVIKLVLPRESHDATLGKLKQMNLTAEMLFGGIDGLAKSLVQTVLRD